MPLATRDRRVDPWVTARRTGVAYQHHAGRAAIALSIAAANFPEERFGATLVLLGHKK